MALLEKYLPKKYYWSYKVVDAGHNYRLSDLNCALGYSQLKKIIDLLIKKPEVNCLNL